MPKEQRRVLPDRPRRAGGRIQPACRAASDLGDVPLCLLGDRERLLLRPNGRHRRPANDTRQQSIERVIEINRGRGKKWSG